MCTWFPYEHRVPAMSQKERQTVAHRNKRVGHQLFKARTDTKTHLLIAV